MSGHRILMIVLSAGLHVALATGLVAVAQKRELRRRAIQVAVTDAKKKEAKPKPPPPPKPIVKPAAPKPAAAPPKAAAAPVDTAHAAAAPVATNLTMSNADSDVGPGIGLHGPAPKAAAAPAKVLASAISEKRTQRTREETTTPGDAPCNEEPTKPQPTFKAEINYSLYPQAQQDGIEGKFKARITVDANGEVTNVEVLASVDPGLDAAVVAALQRWRFKPSTACGKPVAGGTYVYSVTFELAN
jgi:TonB family protein